MRCSLPGVPFGAVAGSSMERLADGAGEALTLPTLMLILRDATGSWPDGTLSLILDVTGSTTDALACSNSI